MLFDGTPGQADLALRAMKHVATAGGAYPLSDADRVALTAANVLVFRGDDRFDPDAIADVSPDAIAAAITKAADVQHVVAYLAVMSIVDGVLDPRRLAAANAYARAFGVHEPYLRDLGLVARGRLTEAVADISRRNIQTFAGRWEGDDLETWVLPYRAHPDPALHARYETLAALPVGTFGRAFHEFYDANHFAYPGVPEAANEVFATHHDSIHVLSGYDTSPQGELLVSTFTAGMHPDQGVAGHVVPVIVSWHLGIELVQFAGSTTGSLDPAKFWVAWARGDETAGDVLAHTWRFWDHVERPLADVRRDLAMPALDPADAADGVCPAWYEPSA